MSFALVWLFNGAGDTDDSSPRVLVGHPGTFSDTVEEATEEGRRILGDEEIDEADRNALTPLAVVEVNEDMGDDIQERCDEVEIGTELLFYDLENYDRWHKQPWWPKT